VGAGLGTFGCIGGVSAQRMRAGKNGIIRKVVRVLGRITTINEQAVVIIRLK
jgi:hypothetical protein